MIYVFVNDEPHFLIQLSDKENLTYTSGSVYDSEMDALGSFAEREVKENGKVAICQRNATLRLFNAKVSNSELLEQSISFDPVDSKNVEDPPFEINATASSGLPVTYSIVSGPAQIEGNIISLTGQIGLVEVLATQEGNTQYAAASAKLTFYVGEVDSGNTPVANHDYMSNWVVTDALGREMPTFDEVGPVRDNRTVGVFYYLWAGYHGDEVYDISKIMESNPSHPLSSDNPAWGAVNQFHWWGESEYGYFRSEDPWVIRRDLQMLSNARVDFIFFDVTNAVTYLETVKELCKVSLQMRLEGIPTPDICFLTNARSGQIMNELYDEFYSKDLYKDLWFYWQFKPLILGIESDPDLRPEVRNFFKIRRSWAHTNTVNEPFHWQWLDKFPQDWGWVNDPNIPEQITVSTAHHPESPYGKSYHNGSQPTVNADYTSSITHEGKGFEEQWKRALEVDPQVVMITQWNEWLAQRKLWDNPSKTHYGGRPISHGDTYFVDVLNVEFNRDIAPMKGGYTDSYYYQMMSNILRYKGMDEPEAASPPKTITLDNDYSDWQDVTPSFGDPAGDVEHRDFMGYDKSVQYTNTTGRNDIVESKVMSDDENLYFYVRTNQALTSSTDNFWMLLFIDVDRDLKTGWEGYDFVVNHSLNSAMETTIKEWSGTEWGNAQQLSISISDREIELAIPRVAMGLENSSLNFHFKWADNPGELNDETTFFLNGDAAPDRRFRYHYKGQSLITGNEKLNQSWINAYPNPADDKLQVTLTSKSYLIIYNLTGQIIYKSEKPNKVFEINVDGWKKGTYVIQARGQSNTVITEKIIVE
ncbi:T9SS type A sorting domain-containing protein [Marinoscillum furvescens]|uniref:Putative secreted protein (Por secretion system target) n=1 Tax=Marinoscillum furvescens DSM 4134 TaxID=1122208 RepID=A0A3D9L439_MARFU|nr:T9SS type A sorting domain-containing protein [Marinoscillum furvescens]RED98341.1 putative secreted protein (Por secretion system target) [Marinoscillum furvescens DSM 4134]